MRTTLLILTISTLLNLQATTQETQVRNEKDFKIEIKEIEDIHMVYYEFQGPYMKSFDNFEKLMGYMHKNQMPIGKYSLGQYYDDPETAPKDKLRSDIGFMVQKPVKTSDGFKYKKIPASKAVTTKYKSMQEIMPAYGAISKYIAENKLNTVEYSIEIYYSADPQVVDAEILFLIKE